MAVSIKMNKNGIRKLQKELERNLKSQILIGSNTALRKDSEEFLRIVLQKRNEEGRDTISCSLGIFNSIPNIDMNIGNILDDLKVHNCISSNSAFYISGEVMVILTMDGIEYFEEKESMIKEKAGNINNTNNFYGEVNGVQIQQGTINSTQTQDVSVGFDYENIVEIENKIKKYDAMFDEEYGQLAVEMRDKLSEIEGLLKKRENPSRIKVLLMDIKNLSMNVVGSVIASGIANLISSMI